MDYRYTTLPWKQLVLIFVVPIAVCTHSGAVFKGDSTQPEGNETTVTSLKYDNTTSDDWLRRHLWPEPPFSLLYGGAAIPMLPCYDKVGQFEMSEYTYNFPIESQLVESSIEYYDTFSSASFNWYKSFVVNVCSSTRVITALSSGAWPAGSYCVFPVASECPNRFGKGGVMSNILNEDGQDIIGPTCCRNDGSPSNQIILPTYKPFYLLPFQDSECQLVVDTNVSLENIVFAIPLVVIATASRTYTARAETITDQFPISKTYFYFCYYTSAVNRDTKDVFSNGGSLSGSNSSTEDTDVPSNDASSQRPTNTTEELTRSVDNTTAIASDGAYNERIRVALIAGLPSAALLVILMVCALVIYNKRRRARINGNRKRINAQPVWMTCTDLQIKREDDVHELAVLSPTLMKILSEDVQLKLHSLLMRPSALQIQEKIGQGAFGTVYRGVYTPDRKRPEQTQIVAIKSLPDTCLADQINTFIDEALIMADFDHAHVLTLIGVCITMETDVPLIVLPFMENGDSKTYLRKFRYENYENEPPDEKQLITFCFHIARGMEYLSAMKVIHRDLAARNCMLDSKLVVKVADFGLSRDIYTTSYYRQDRQKRLPIKWMAIESIVDHIFTIHTDVWSFGVTMWEVITLGKVPYPEVEHADIIRHLNSGARLQKPDACSDSIYSLMASCWDVHPENRPTFTDISKNIANYISLTCNYLDLCSEQSTPPAYVNEIGVPE